MPDSKDLTPCPFKPGSKIVCVDPHWGRPARRLTKGRVYVARQRIAEDNPFDVRVINDSRDSSGYYWRKFALVK